MKKLFSTILLVLLTTIAVAQSQHFDFNVTTPGTLKSLIAARGELFIFDMKVTGNIDERDIKCLRDNNPALAFLDLSETTINEYIAYEGTANEQFYAANEIPVSAFANSRGTSSLVSIKLPNTTTIISESAFSGCTALTEVIFPPSVTTIGNDAFSGCTAFKSFIIPNTIKTIGGSVFYDCNGLTSLTIPNSVTYLGTLNVLSNLKDITIGNAVSRMGVITGCKKLETITFLGITPPEFASNQFFYLSSLENIYVPAASVAAYKASKIADLFYSKIKANPTDDITSLTSGVKVYASRSEIVVEGVAPREIVTLYSISGKQLKIIVSTGERLNIPVDKQGIYLVKTGGKTYKVVV